MYKIFYKIKNFDFYKILIPILMIGGIIFWGLFIEMIINLWIR